MWWFFARPPTGVKDCRYQLDSAFQKGAKKDKLDWMFWTDFFIGSVCGLFVGLFLLFYYYHHFTDIQTLRGAALVVALFLGGSTLIGGIVTAFYRTRF
jgi:hypothetical protein